MRCILILSIVIGHVFAIYSLKESSSWTIPMGLSYISCYSWINSFFISFSLQAFVLISGYIYEYQGFRDGVMAKKTKRLLIPLVLFGIMYMVLIEKTYGISIESVYHLLNGPGHLWFLPMLFWCFVIAIIFSPYIKKNINNPLLWIILVIISVSSVIVYPILRINNALFYFIFFVLGMFSYIHRTLIMSWSVKKTIVLGVTTLLLCIARYEVSTLSFFCKSLFLTIINLCVGVTGSLLLLKICLGLSNYNKLILIGSWSGFFGVYLIHQFIVKYLYYNCTFLTYINPYIIPFVVLVITLIVSIITSEILLHFKLTKKLI